MRHCRDEAPVPTHHTARTGTSESSSLGRVSIRTRYRRREVVLDSRTAQSISVSMTIINRWIIMPSRCAITQRTRYSVLRTRDYIAGLYNLCSVLTYCSSRTRLLVIRTVVHEYKVCCLPTNLHQPMFCSLLLVLGEFYNVTFALCHRKYVCLSSVCL